MTRTSRNIGAWSLRDIRACCVGPGARGGGHERADYLAECAATEPEIRLLLACGVAIVEPCVGGGAIVDGLVQCWGIADVERDIITGDIRDVGADWQGDWLSKPKHWRWNRDVRDRLSGAGLVVSNPAFAIARETVEAAWRHCPRAVVAMLLPARWYAHTKDRGAWLREHNPDRINIGRCEFFRPDGSSAGDGDSTDYEWMIWGPDRQGPRGGHHELRPWKEAPHA
jgi:hypothetical protein